MSFNIAEAEMANSDSCLPKMSHWKNQFWLCTLLLAWCCFCSDFSTGSPLQYALISDQQDYAAATYATSELMDQQNISDHNELANNNEQIVAASAKRSPDNTCQQQFTPTDTGKTRPLYVIEREVLKQLFARYEKSIRPYPLEGDGATNVSVNFFVRSISSINEISMEFTIDLLVRQYWNDPRLRFNVPGNENITYLKTSLDYLQRLWIPDLFFPTERRGATHVITIPNHMIRIYPNGNVLFTARYTMAFACDMNLVKYPFDVQLCVVQAGSFSSTVESVLFLWKEESPVIVNRDLSLPKFTLGTVQTLPCENVHPTGNFSCLRVQFEFKRQLGFHLVESYLPTTLLVIASWMGFWIDAGSVPGRVSLAVTTMLTTVASSTNIKHTLPPVSYVKAIDIWLGVCIFSVFMALAEFAVVNYLSRQDRKCSRVAEKTIPSNRRQYLLKEISDLKNPALVENNNFSSPLKRLTKPGSSIPALPDPDSGLFCVRQNFSTSKQRAKTVDRYARIVFPSFFFVVVLFYMLVFTML